MQNKLVISVLPSSQGRAQLPLKVLLDKWSLSLAEGFCEASATLDSAQSSQGHLGSSNPNYPAGMGKETTPICCSKIIEFISFSGITWRNGSFGAQSQMQRFTSLGGVTPLEHSLMPLCVLRHCSFLLFIK